MSHECIGNADQECWRCHVPLVCEDDYIGGGSHYWALRCPACGEAYSYDTYGFRLYQVRGGGMLIAPDARTIGDYDADHFRFYKLAEK